jgi:hypothetical protein
MFYRELFALDPALRKLSGSTDMATFSSRLDRIWIFWQGPSSRRILSSETILIGRQSIVCRLAFSPPRRWSFGAESVLWMV